MRWTKCYYGSADLKQPKEGDAGYDLPACGNYFIQPNEIVEIQTGIAVEIPKGFVGLVLGRSGNAFKKHIECFHNGVIDSGYRGEIKVLLMNHGDQPIEIWHGNRVAQLVVVLCYTQPLEYADRLSETDRGTDGFGSSGVIGG